MRRHRSDPLDRATAERLLAGEGGPPRLAELLSAAASPARATELAGEDAAAAVFRSTGSAPVVRRRRVAVRIAWARLMSVNAALVLVLALGGVALAASTGVIPNPLRDGQAPAPDPVASAPTTTSAVPSTANTSGDSASPAASGQAPFAALEGLCRAYQAAAGGGHGHQELKNPRFGALVAAAGGEDKVPVYCVALTSGPTPRSTGPAKSTDHPTGPPANRPTPHATVPVSPGRPGHETSDSHR